jgi:tetratricopeptide (TPR) repeat protein
MIAGSYMPSAVTQKPQNPPTPGTPPTTPESDPMLNVLAWIEINRGRILGGVAAAIALFGVVYLYRHFAAEREAAANTALLSLRAKPGEPDSAPKAPAFLTVAEQHSGSANVGLRARLLAAGAFYTDGKYAEAQAEFEKLLASAGSGPLGAQADFGVAASLDALDKVDQAAARYQEIISKYAGESVAAQARLALARIQEGRNQAEAALRLYDELIRDKDSATFSQQATQLREELVRKNPALATAGASSSTAPAAPAKSGN